ncbi:Retrotransposon protein, Ty1-Copia subclass [Phytophthora palmivora]|uniref:Retrotransposon protein, Ty1-Copia subclass n=1 Tax=Phytophthora palmivora TaxID=4796 RepID=A0A2P4Y941_9STRA|nr:Retrotransposon protein, Ty1-Copia subclass [Phytophthora palmivora]
MGGFGLGVVPEQTPVSTGGPVAGSSSEVPVGAPMSVKVLLHPVNQSKELGGQWEKQSRCQVVVTIMMTIAMKVHRFAARRAFGDPMFDCVIARLIYQRLMEAADSEKRIEALNNEYSELLRNKTWELVEKPEGVKVLTSKWVFVRKRNAQGQIERHRAALQ